MKFKQFAGAFFLLILSFCAAEIRAQSPESSQTLFSFDDKNSPFKDGETSIAGVTFTGLDSYKNSYYAVTGPLLFEEEFRGILIDNRFGILYFPDWKFNREKAGKLIEIIKDKITGSGYLEAKVSAVGKSLADNKMQLIISVERGEPSRVSEIRFVGNKNVSGAELIEAFKDRNENWQIFRNRSYKHYLDASSRQVMVSKGFLQAKITRIVPEKTSYGYIVTIEVEEGSRYRIGEIKTIGAKIFSENEILEMLGQNAGEIADGRDLAQFFNEKLKRIYADRGYILYRGKFDLDYIKPQVEGLDGIVNIRAAIEEGRVYKISKIDFWEFEKFPENKAAELRRISGLTINDIYSQNAIEKALKNFDATNEFEPTDIGRDLHLKANEETGELEINFTLSRKE